MSIDNVKHFRESAFNNLRVYLVRLNTPRLPPAPLWWKGKGLMRSLPQLLLAILLTPVPAFAAQYFMYVGSYTHGKSRGIYAWAVDSKVGSLKSLGLVAETPQPIHLWIAPSGKTLYAVNGENDGSISAFHVDQKTGALTFLNKTSSHGAQPNQVVVDPSGRVAVTVTYTSGTLAAFNLEPDGKLGEAFYVDQHTGKPLSAKRRGSIQHGIQFSKDDRYVYIADLGLDRVYSYHFDASVPSITPCDRPYVTAHAGAGPRRIQMSPEGKFLYVDHATDSEVGVYTIDGCSLKEIQVIGTVPDQAKAHNTTAELLISADGKFLYVGNQGHDTVSVFAVDKRTGMLTLKENVPSGGHIPRNLRIDPSGNWFFAANWDGGNVTEFRIDRTSGHLTPTGVTASIDRPAGLYFLKAR